MQPTNKNTSIIQQSFDFSNERDLLDFESPKLTNTSVYDLIFNYLVNNHVISQDGSINPRFPKDVPQLKEIQLARMNEVLNTTFSIKSNTYSGIVPNHIKKLLATLNISSVEFTVETSLSEICKSINVNDIEIVGGTVFWILGPEYMKQVALNLKIPEDQLTDDFFSEYASKAVDVDIRIYTQEPAKLLSELCDFFVSKLPEALNTYSFPQRKEIIKNFAFSKYFKKSDRDDNFEMISLSDNQGFTTDILMIKNLKRKNLFSHDGVNLTVSGFSRENMYFSNTRLPLQSLALKLSRVLAAKKAEEIDVTGASMLFSYLVKGWRCKSKELQEILLNTFFNSRSFTHLSKLKKNHFPNVKGAGAIICFNVCSLLKTSENFLLNVVKELSTTTDDACSEDSALASFKSVMHNLDVQSYEREQAKSDFKLIYAFLQLFGKVFADFKSNEKKEVDVHVTSQMAVSQLQIQFNTSSKPLHIMVCDDANSALKIINEEHESALLQNLESFCKHFTFATELNFNKVIIGPKIDGNELSKVALIFLDKNESMLTGFYFLCYAGVIEGHSRYLSTLLKTAFKLLKDESSLKTRRNIIYALTRYWASTSPETLVKEPLLALFNSFELNVKDFCMCFVQILQSEISTFIATIYQEHESAFDVASKFQLFVHFKLIHKSIAVSLAKNLLEPSSICKLNEKNVNTLLKFLENRINSLPPFESLPKYDDISVYFLAISQIIRVDFNRGHALLVKLQEQKAVHKGFATLLLEAQPEEKTALTLEWHKKYPLTVKSTVKEIEERLKLLFACNENDLITQSVINILKQLLLLPKSKLKSITPFIKQKLVSLCEKILARNDFTPSERIALFLKIADYFDTQILFNNKLLPLCLLLLRNILSLKTDNSKELDTVLNFLNKCGARDRKLISKEEYELYHDIISVSLTFKKIEIAAEFLTKLKVHENPSTQPLTHKTSIFTLEAIDAFIEQNQMSEALALLTDFDVNLQSFNINTNGRWELILISKAIPTTKKLPFLVSKAEVLAKNTAFVQIATQAVENACTAKNDRSREVVDLMKLYNLRDVSIFQKLGKMLLTVKNQESAEHVFINLHQILGIELSQLACLFLPLVRVESDFSLLFLHSYYTIFSEGHNSEYLFDFMEGFLDLLNFSTLHLDKIQSGFKVLATIVPIPIRETSKYRELNMLFIEKLTPTSGAILVILDTITELAVNAKPEEATKLLQHFKSAFKNYKTDTTICEMRKCMMVRFLNSSKRTLPSTVLLELFNLLDGNLSTELLNLFILLAIDVSKKMPSNLTQKQRLSYATITTILKKIIDLCFAHTLIVEVTQIIRSNKLFKDEEIQFYLNKIANTLLKNVALGDIKDIPVPLSIYRQQLFAINEHPKYQKENLQLAIDVILSLFFKYKNKNLYYSELAIFMKTLLGYENPNSLIFRHTHIPYLTNDGLLYPAKPDILQMTIMKNKTYFFFLTLTEGITASFIKSIEKPELDSYEIVHTNFVHLSHLVGFGPGYKKDTIKAALNMGYLMTMMPVGVNEEFQKNLKALTEIMLQQKFLFSDDVLDTSNCIELAVLTEQPLTFLEGSVNSELIPLTILKLIKHLISLNNFFSCTAAFYYIQKHKEMLKNGYTQQTQKLLNHLIHVSQVNLQETPPAEPEVEYTHSTW
jgi:hypothetical protein